LEIQYSFGYHKDNNIFCIFPELIYFCVRFCSSCIIFAATTPPPEEEAMPVLKAKSSDNLSAANYLQSMRLYAPSVHCSYYSCFQLSKHFLNSKGKNYHTQSLECGGKDSHNYIINETQKYITDSLLYNREMKILKTLRRKADYQNDIITPNDASKALASAKQTRKLLAL
jgi:uncharacterized protein (UPF0332 family)